jgi:hypothetical protein
MNILMPVVSIARLIPFHDATIEYFWRAVRGRRGSGAAGAGGSLTLLSVSFLLSPLLANFPNSHPMIETFSFTYPRVSLDNFYKVLIELFFNLVDSFLIILFSLSPSQLFYPSIESLFSSLG